jgi:hypothetical protein
MTFPEDDTQVKVASIVPAETKTEALAVPAKATAIIVCDQDSLDAANRFMHDIDALIAKISKTYDPRIKQAHQLHKDLLADKSQFVFPLESAKRLVSRKASDFIYEQERIRREVERKRLEAEEKARAIADKAVEKADKLESNGKDKAAALIVNEAHEKVNEILEAAPEVPDKLDTSGLAIQENWKFSIVDEALIPREWLVPDEKKIGRIVRACKEQTDIPGIRVYCEKGVATRSSGNRFQDIA